jgi:YidC/Oxa1 family membrane protein insertase
MDRNQITGIVLILALLTAYYAFFAPQPVSTPKPPKSETTASAPFTTAPGVLRDSAEIAAQRAKLGTFADAATGEEKEVVLENKDIRITLSTLGGKVKSVVLKNYEERDGSPVKLFDSVTNTQVLEASTASGPVDLASLYFNTAAPSNITVAESDTQSVTFELTLGNNQTVRQTYALAGNGFQVGYNLKTSGMDNQIGNQPLRFYWKDNLRHIEYDIEQSRAATTVNYYTADGDFDNLSETSTDPQTETLEGPLKWVSLRQKFFNAAIIAENQFTGGKVASTVNTADTNIVKTLEAEVFIPVSDVSSAEGGNYRFFFGPNQYNINKKVTEGFERNVYLGWALFAWVNKYLIIPIFNFLEGFIGSYGIIIIVLVLIIKLLLFPLTYKSYISMAKTKALKPELDALKEKYGDDMQKIQSEQMKLYSQVGVNPISGCIPMLLQMPILFAMFNFFPNSIELRHESFLWAHDLSTYDSILNLPFKIPGYGSHVSLFTILMTISTLAYTWFNNQVSTVTGPMKSMTYVMPVVFMFILNSLPAGLSFYYFVSNVVTIGQQLIIRNFVDDNKIRRILDENKVKNKDKKKSGFQQRLENAMKAAEQSKNEQNRRNDSKKK